MGDSWPDGLPSGTTRLAAVIGDPVLHSLSPLIHNTGFRLLGLDWVFVACEVARGGGKDALDAMRTLGIEGLSVTMPLKEEVIAGVDRLSAVAQRLGAVNVISRVGNELVGDNTDGLGFINSLRHDQKFEPEAKRCVVVGAGGAARAVILALAEAGAAEVVVVARRPEQGEVAASLATAVGRVGALSDIRAADLVVNATPVGMNGNETSLPFDPALLGSGQLVCDLIYHPLKTSLLAAAASNGTQVVNGVGMLIHQAALAFRLWTGETAPLNEMTAAVREVLTNT